MNAPSSRNTIDTPSGIGTVYHGQTSIATVRYALEIRPVMPHRRSSSRSRVVDDSSNDVSGRVEIVSGGLFGAVTDTRLLVLALEDGRQLPFYLAEHGSSVRILAAGAYR